MSNRINNDKKVSLVIPAYNEEEHISKVINAGKDSELVDEIIVLDDGSKDRTSEIAKKAGAKVFRSEKNNGKGYTMSEGVQKSKGDVIVFLDGDLKNINSQKIEKMILPTMNGYDFVKASFFRGSGRVTELTAKPLLKIFFPELDYQQPLGGQIALKRQVANELQFEPGFKVDIGLLIDVSMNGHKVKEVSIGEIQHDKRQLSKIKYMAKEVAETILERAKNYGRFDKV